MSIVHLIRTVKDHPLLYDSSLMEYRDLELRNSVWEQISAKLNEPVEDVKTKWARLRNCYASALKRRQQKSMNIPWKFEKQMRFLKPHMRGKPKNKSLTTVEVNIMKEESKEDKDEISYFIDESDPFERPTSPCSVDRSPTDATNPLRSPYFNQQNKSTDAHNLLNEVEVEYKRSFEMDESDLFFLSMSKRLKNLPYAEQVEIKLQLHKLIYEADKRLLNADNA